MRSAVVSVESVEQAKDLIRADRAEPVNLAFAEFVLMPFQSFRVGKGLVTSNAKVLACVCWRFRRERGAATVEAFS
jgi:hypothetical protein